MLYAKMGTSIFKTSNSGATWTLQSTLPATGSTFTINVRTPSLIYFVRQALGDSPISTVFRSANEGNSWDIAGTINISLPVILFRATAWEPSPVRPRTPSWLS